MESLCDILNGTYVKPCWMWLVKLPQNAMTYTLATGITLVLYMYVHTCSYVCKDFSHIYVYKIT